MSDTTKTTPATAATAGTAAAPADGVVHLHIAGGIAAIVFDRPKARNAMTWAMYAQLIRACELVQEDASVRVVTLRGAGGEAFVAGTDIEQFAGFKTGDDGVAYERRIDACIAQIERLTMPTIAICEGWTVGGGLAIAAACDFRIATPSVKFGVPIARTLGNCLSVTNVARLASLFGVPRVKRMLMLAEMLDAQEAVDCGFVLQLCEPAAVDAAARKLCERLAVLAPVTQTVAKEALRRIGTHGLPEGEDLIKQAYGSEDFHEGVAAFVGKRSPSWKGR